MTGAYGKDGNQKGHCIALFSGGLDSALAILLMLEQNIEVTAITFMSHFGCDLGDRSSCGSNPYPTAEKYGFNVKLMHLGQKFVDIVENPKHGRGKNMNPCTDCRILMLNEAREFMEMVNDAEISSVITQLFTRPSGLAFLMIRPYCRKVTFSTLCFPQKYS